MASVLVKVQTGLLLSLVVLLILNLNLVEARKSGVISDDHHKDINNKGDYFVEETRVKSLPGFNGSLPFEMHTGYISVNESTSNELFYFFIKSERNASEDPLILWLSGGPGCSALTALAYETGPIHFVWKPYNGTLPELELNPYPLTKKASVIFLDSPTGTGFSYSKCPSKDYATGDYKTVREAYNFLLKWFARHPEFLSNPFYIAGDSYSGITIPMVALAIANGIEQGTEPTVNFKGYMLGNPVTDREHDAAQVPFSRGMGYISEELYEETATSCKGKYYATNSSEECAKNVAEVDELIDEINKSHVLEYNCGDVWSPRPRNVSPRRAIYESAPDHISLHSSAPPIVCRGYSYYLGYVWMNNETVRTALNVKKNTTGEWLRCINGTVIDFTEEVYTVVDYHVALLNKGYSALIYSGDHDMLVPFMGTEGWIRSLNLTMVEDWRPWYVGDQVGGFTRKFSQNLTFATVKGAGHTAPEYKTRDCQSMFFRWISENPI